MTTRDQAAVGNRILNSVRFGQTTLVTDETGVVQKMQIQTTPYENMTVPSVQHYGLASSVPLGGDAVMVNAEGHNSKGVVIATNHQSHRPTGLLTGETQLYDNTKQNVYLTQGKKILLNANAEVDIYIGGTLVFSLTSSLLTINVDVQVKGAIKSTGDQTAGTISQMNHVHGKVMSGAGNTDVPVPGT